MPETNVLYSVTALVVLGLVAWLLFVLKSAKEPWARPREALIPKAEHSIVESDESETKPIDP